ncbi:hypothetical protein ACK6T9_18765, partial [Proteus vulgaris]|uniref:hypothetical protein n=1 Tax=Proteus vulgaris TaxID=585 RepID=UPI0039B37708
VAAALARVKAKKAQQTSQATPTVEAPAESAETEEVDPRKAAVVAALARVKAKKAQQTSQATPTVEAHA